MPGSKRVRPYPSSMAAAVVQGGVVYGKSAHLADPLQGESGSLSAVAAPEPDAAHYPDTTTTTGGRETH